MKNITVIIPIYNEYQNIKILLPGIINKYPEISILIVNDGSDDWTISELKNIKYDKLKVINNDKNRWLTFSIIKWIINSNTDFFIVIDWDNQHPIKNIKDFIYFFNLWSDIVIWNRKNIEFEKQRYRKYISYIWNYLINFKLKWKLLKIKDPLSWFFWGKTIIFKKTIKNNSFFFSDRWYKFLFEFLLISNLSLYNISTFSFDFWKRKFWKSKLWIRECFIFFIGLFK